ncbi:hypothetical protein [Candidatus Halobonum tyrrellensis]|uniref:Uncharacterized protein n=1 Tax=Candidatus Halobonum tyrrellensis G22 TaxID=1324957 RepID=V4HD94_9EURY|nr:hypothetical protein [Candidatus Halobonum tyrrellensis]ESP88038.1 hypothetical protein K933_10819 [Candidatus Halobonum tyrrellensis G22]
MSPRVPPPSALVPPVALALLVVAAGCAGPLLGGPPETTVENSASDEYRVDVYTVPVDDPAALEFSRATDGGRRPLDARDVQFPSGERNVTLDNEGATLQRRVVLAPGENVTATLDGWNRGETTVYLVETADERLVYTRVVDCGSGDQSHTLTVESNESFRASSTCGGF